MEWYRAQLEVRKPTVEKWPPDNTYVNHWKIDTTMLFAPGRVQNVSEDRVHGFVVGFVRTLCFGIGPHRPAIALLRSHEQLEALAYIRKSPRSTLKESTRRRVLYSTRS